jgi:hypothetical protein
VKIRKGILKSEMLVEVGVSYIYIYLVIIDILSLKFRNMTISQLKISPRNPRKRLG